MIQKKAEYGDNENVTIALFGHGSVHMTNMKRKDNSSGDILFNTGTPTKVGDTWKHNKDCNVLAQEAEIVFRFDNIESIDAVISQLKNLKEFLKEPENQ